LTFKTAFVQGGLFNAVSRAKYSRKRLYYDSAPQSFTVDYREKKVKLLQDGLRLNQPTYFGRHLMTAKAVIVQMRVQANTNFELLLLVFFHFNKSTCIYVHFKQDWTETHD
jgi:hypothetical protein